MAAERTTVRRARVPGWLTSFGPAIAIVVVQQVLFPSRASDGEYLWGLVLQGLTLGLLTALVALGMALVYRANRILNFAQGDLGLVPAALAIDLVVFSGLHYVLALIVGLAAAVVVGGVVELAIVRRFFRSGRLLLTVATIGLAQLLAFGSLMMPRLWGEDPLNTRIEVPLSWRVDIAPLVFDGELPRWRGCWRRLAIVGRGAVPALHPRRHRGASRGRPGRPGVAARHPRGPPAHRACGRSPPSCRSSPCSCRPGSSACRSGRPSGSPCCSARWRPSCSGACPTCRRSSPARWRSVCSRRTCGGTTS